MVHGNVKNLSLHHCVQQHKPFPTNFKSSHTYPCQIYIYFLYAACNWKENSPIMYAASFIGAKRQFKDSVVACCSVLQSIAWLQLCTNVACKTNAIRYSSIWYLMWVSHCSYCSSTMRVNTGHCLFIVVLVFVRGSCCWERMEWSCEWVHTRLHIQLPRQSCYFWSSQRVQVSDTVRGRGQVQIKLL